MFAGLRAIHRSLAETGRLADFDFFILSDTRDPDVWVEEELRWQDMVRALDGRDGFSTATGRRTPTARAATWRISAPAGAVGTAT